MLKNNAKVLLFLHNSKKNTNFVAHISLHNYVMTLRKSVILLILTLLSIAGQGARNVRIYGYVTDSENTGIELANVYLKDSTIGTSTNRNGYYDLQFRMGDTVTVVFSMLGYVTTEQRIYTTRDVVNINVVLPTDAEALDELEVRGIRKQLGTMEQADAKTTRVMPDATGGGIESILITFAGVRQNNELSSQYNVRGGSFDENSVYVNGIEVHRPLLLRAGQQEGLSFVNPEMTETVEFSAGGFDARYGDKMSSVLDITYKRPTSTEATISASLLGANAYVGFGGERYSQMHSIRYKTSKYMLGALPTAGSYQPNFVDYQTFMTWKTGSKKTAEESLRLDGLKKGQWEFSVLGNFSQNTYSFRPDSVSTSSGGFSDEAKKLSIYYDGQEKDIFRTAFAALAAQGNVGRGVEIGFTLSGFYTNEQENYDITGQYRLTENPMGSTATGTDSSESSGVNKDEDLQGQVDDQVLGKGTYHEHARNKLQAGVINFSHDGSWKYDANRMNWGVSLQGELISDQISEWTWRDSAGYSMPNSENGLELDYSMKGESQLRSLRMQAYLQDTYRWSTDAGDVILTAGARLNWWSFTNEVLCSPRASVVYLPGWKRDLTLRFATGLYYQSPFYKELKDTITGDDGITRFTLNKGLRAQRSVHVVLGADYYFRAWGRPFKFTSEAYYKYIDRMESYTVDNVRVRYSGKNDAEGYATGLDLKLMGELVPGADSWVSFGLMRSKQRLIGEDGTKGDWLMGSNEQRFAFSMLFQDYFPRLPQLMFHIKGIYSDGLPYSMPGNIEKQGRMPSYKRVDIGATYSMRYGREKWMKNPHVQAVHFQFDVFNIVGFHNVNSYFFARDYYGRDYHSPNYLTGRMYNLKVTIDLK